MARAPAPTAPLRDFRLLCAALGLSFFFPAWTYLFSPAAAVAQFEGIGRLLGAGAYPLAEAELGLVWRVLAAGNVMTLAMMCFLLAWRPRGLLPVLAPLLFMKGFASLGYLGAWVKTAYPAFLAVSAWDAVNCGLLVFFARRALLL